MLEPCLSASVRAFVAHAHILRIDNLFITTCADTPAKAHTQRERERERERERSAQLSMNHVCMHKSWVDIDRVPFLRLAASGR